LKKALRSIPNMRMIAMINLGLTNLIKSILCWRNF